MPFLLIYIRKRKIMDTFLSEMNCDECIYSSFGFFLEYNGRVINIKSKF